MVGGMTYSILLQIQLGGWVPWGFYARTHIRIHVIRSVISVLLRQSEAVILQKQIKGLAEFL